MELSEIRTQWDLLVIGGGIAGAGILSEAARLGIRVLLCEERDFAWGTSSRSSKLVHGGLRYLKEGRFHLTHESVIHRQRLLAEAPGLVTPIPFLMPIHKGMGPGRLATKIGLSIYDMMAGRWGHRYLAQEEFLWLAPGLGRAGLQGGFLFQDAQTDDARLVLRLIFEAEQRGATALNYTRVLGLSRDRSGMVSGASLQDTDTGQGLEVQAKAVINATGPRAGSFHDPPDPGLGLRPLRGSHLVFPHWRLPVHSAITLIHPQDHRPLFVFPWEGAVILGTTDVDHTEELSQEPTMSPQEALYMMECLEFHFPSWEVKLEEALSAYSGVRAVLSRDPSRPPSRESREHMVWKDRGLVTVTGGKLTTFRVLARDALHAAAQELGLTGKLDLSPPAYEPDGRPPALGSRVSSQTWRRLWGRYGTEANRILDAAEPEELEAIPGTRILWAELAHAAAHEKVRHLEDLLLRRVRLGILTRDGGMEHLERIKKICLPRLGWDEGRWEREKGAYMRTIRRAYGVPEVPGAPLDS